MNGFNGRTGLSQDDLSRYRSYVPGVDDVIWAPLYDYQAYPVAGSLQFNFFNQQKGTGTTSAFGGAGARTIQDTNMQLSGQLGAGNQFLVMGIEVEFWPGTTPALASAAAATQAQISAQANDVYTVLRNGILNFSVQNRPYVEDGPLLKFPTQTYLTGWAAVSNGANATAQATFDYASSSGMSYNIVPVLLVQNQAFQCSVTFPALTVLPSGVIGRIGVRLNGKLIRNAQ